MEKLEYLIRIIRNCDLCNGTGALYWSNDDDYDFVGVYALLKLNGAIIVTSIKA